MNTDDARRQLVAADLFFDVDDEMPPCTINLNDVFGWAWADCETVPEDKLVEVAELYFAYGWCGILYWVSERREGMRSEFKDVNRRIDFVRNEERLKQEEPNSSKRAYKDYQYTLGAE